MPTIHRFAMVSVAVALTMIALPGCKPSQPEPEGTGGDIGRSIAPSPTRDDGDLASGTSTFSQGMKLAAGGVPIDVEIGHLVPCVTDWNSDGKKDLLVGQFKSGAIRLYLNQGTDTEPIFEDFSMLHAGGKPIRLDAG